ncbi:glycosyltransferase family 8 protein [Microcoleus sp. Pol7_A1]|uniref:glycosyltransferase family 8 protein n=1 Tax=Microcoleus sp. Pol7_A1 TaxID=2818893 RepID=UPI002FD71577
MTNTKNQPIVLVSTADDNYAMALAVTVKSALVNLKNKRKVLLYVLDGNITPAKKHKILKSLDSELIEIFWVQPDEALFVNMKIDEKYNTLAVYYRLFIPELIPQHFDKAIYLDSDIVVLGDLEQLWNSDIGDNYVLAVQDIWQRYIRKAKGLRNYQEIGLSPDYKYFNAGVLVINLEKWRADNIGTKAIEFLEQNRDYVRWHDQDGLNGVLAGKWGELDPRWNQMQAIYEYSSWTESPYTEDVFNQVLHNPHIVHFATFPKPWQQNCKHPKQDLFFDYLALTAWGCTDTSLPNPSIINSD